MSSEVNRIKKARSITLKITTVVGKYVLSNKKLEIGSFDRTLIPFVIYQT